MTGDTTTLFPATRVRPMLAFSHALLGFSLFSHTLASAVLVAVYEA
jgi:hypothetical protein